MHRWWQQRRASLLAGLLLALLPLLLAATPILERLELLTYDARFQWRGPRAAKTPIVLAQIDRETTERWKEDPLVFWGEHVGDAISQARKAGAAWIGLDYIQAIDPGLYLGRKFGVPDTSIQAFALALNPGNVVLSWDGTNEPIPQLLYAHPRQVEDVGLVLALQSEGAIRRGFVYDRAGNTLLPSLPAVLALRLRGESPRDLEALRRLAGKPRQGEAQGTAWINYVGRPGAFPTVSLVKLAEGSLSPTERERLKGAVVLIGASYFGANDLHRGPLGDYLGTEILAHLLSTLAEGRAIRRLEPAQELGLAAGMGVLAAAVVAFLPLGWGVLLLAAVMGAWTLAATQAFARDLALPMVGPLLAVALGGGGHYVVRAWEEARRRAQIESIFGPRLSKPVLNRLLENPEMARLGGVRRELTILFSDIRGFTAMSEKMAPEEVVSKLNEYLPRMEECVDRAGGTIDKYIGDAVMAFWNAPDHQPDHALRAVSAAWEMLQALERLNQEWAQAGLPALRIGIGLNTGEVLVGNVGSERLKSYTVIGSAVNQASRLEGANKDLGTSILLGAETYRQVKERVSAREHIIHVKGVDEPLTVYELLEFRTA